MKRPFSFGASGPGPLLAASTALIAATYGLVRLAYGLVLPDVQRDLGLDAGPAGLIGTASSLVYVVAALTALALADRHPRGLVAAAGLTAGLGAVGMAAAPGPGMFGVAAAVSSAGAGLASPALVRVVARHVRRADVDRAQTTVNAGTGPGLVLAGLLALTLLPGWRAAWLVVAAATLVVAALVLLLDRAGGAGGRGGAGGARPRSGGAGVAAPAATRVLPPAPWFRAHARVVVAALLLGAGSAAVWTYGRAALVDAGAGSTVSVVAWVALGLGGAAVIGTASWLTSLGPQRAWVLTALAVGAASGGLALLPRSTAGALAACAVFGWGYTAATGALIAWTSRIDPDRAPAGTSLLFVLLVLGQAGGASLAGALVDASGYATALLVAGVVAGAAAVVGAGRDRGRPARAGVSPTDAVGGQGRPL